LLTNLILFKDGIIFTLFFFKIALYISVIIVFFIVVIGKIFDLIL